MGVRVPAQLVELRTQAINGCAGWPSATPTAWAETRRILAACHPSPRRAAPERGGATERRDRLLERTPLGASPLLANLYLHWFDVLFYGRKGRCQTGALRR